MDCEASCVDLFFFVSFCFAAFKFFVETCPIQRLADVTFVSDQKPLFFHLRLRCHGVLGEVEGPVGGLCRRFPGRAGGSRGVPAVPGAVPTKRPGMVGLRGSVATD